MSAGLCLGTFAVYEQRVIFRGILMPKLPNMSAAAVMKRKIMTKARKAEMAKEPPPPPVVKVRIAKPR